MTSAVPFSIPTISLREVSSSPTRRQETIDSLRNAALSSGFFQLVDLDDMIQIREPTQGTLTTNGGDKSPSATLISSTFKQMESFFSLPSEVKAKVVKKNHLVGGYEGWKFYDLTKTGDGGKKNDYREYKDRSGDGWNEGFAIAPEWGTNCFLNANASTSSETFDPSTFEKTCKDYFYTMQELGRQVLSMIAEGLGQPPDFFEPYLEGQNSFCRLTHYYRPGLENRSADNTTNDPAGVELGAASHTDWGALTLLVQDSVGGLQVFDRNTSTWHEVPCLPTAIVCNIGDLLAHWTNGVYRSTLHRVVAPKRGVHRYSIPFFNPGNPSYLVKTIPTCVAAGESPRYEPITAGEYITKRHMESTQ